MDLHDVTLAFALVVFYVFIHDSFDCAITKALPRPNFKRKASYCSLAVLIIPLTELSKVGLNVSYQLLTAISRVFIIFSSGKGRWHHFNTTLEFDRVLSLAQNSQALQLSCADLS